MPDKTVFVVDDDAAVRQGLRFMLRWPGMVSKRFHRRPRFSKSTTRDAAAAYCSMCECPR
jgi:FixJ family two-component response regulator